METTTKEKDLSKLSTDQLKAELEKRTAQKDEDRKAYKDLVNTCVGETVNALKKVSIFLAEMKLNTFQDLKTLLDMKKDVYDLKTSQQSHTFSDAQGNTITYGYRVLDGWDDTVNAGEAKVNQFIQSLAKDDESAKLVNALNRLLKKDANGQLKASRVLELQKMAEEFNDDVFTDGVNIIRKAYKPVRSCFFIDASFTDEQGKKVNIPLSISAADFPEGTIISELFPVAA